MSKNAKMVIAVVCAVVGVIAIIYAVIYIAVPIHSLPGFVPGKKATTGHYHKRAFLSGVIGVVLLAIAVYLGMTSRNASAAPMASSVPPAQGAGSEGGAGPV